MAQQEPKDRKWSHDVSGIVAPLPRPNRDVPCHLNCSKDGQRLVYGCDTGVVVRCLPDALDGALRPVTVYFGAKHPITVACCSPCGTIIAGGDSHGTLYIWTEQQPHGLKMKTYNVGMNYVRLTDLSFSEDSSHLACCGTDAYSKKLATCIVVLSGNASGNICGHQKGVNSISIRQQKPFKIAAVGVDNLLTIYDGPPFRLTKTLHTDAAQHYCCRYSPDGSHLATCSATGELCFWHPITGAFDRSVVMSSRPLLSLAWSPKSERIVVVSEDNTIRLFDAVADRLTGCIHLSDCVNPRSPPVGVCWGFQDKICILTADGRILGFSVEEEGSASGGGSTSTGRLAFQWHGPAGMPRTLGRNIKTGSIVCGTNTGQLLWADSTFHITQTCHLREGASDSSIVSIILGCSTGFAVTSGSTIFQFQLKQHETLCDKYPTTPTAATNRRKTDHQAEDDKQSHQKSSKLSVRSESIVPSDTPRVIVTDAFRGDPVSLVTLDNDRFCAVVCADGSLHAYPWEVKRTRFESKWTLKLDVGEITAAAATADGTLLAFAVKGGSPVEATDAAKRTSSVTLEIYECGDATSENCLKLIWSFDWHKTEITAVAISCDGIRLASSDSNCNIFLSDLRTGEQLIHSGWNLHTAAITCLDWSADSAVLASGSVDGSIRLWDAEQNEEGHHIQGAHVAEISSLKFIETNTVASIGHDGLIVINRLIRGEASMD